MPLFERPPLETLAPARDRWTPIYLEHGRLEVDDSSVKWIGADGTLCRIPAATVSALLLGPGTTVTHAAMKACAESNTPVCWTGEECLRFYAFGLTPNHTNDMPRLHAEAWADKRRRTRIARAMFRMRFPDVDVADLYKHLTNIPAAFLAVRQDPKNEGDLVRKLLKQRVEEERLLQRMPKDLATLFETDEAAPQQAGARPA